MENTCITATIDGAEYQVPSNSTIIEAASHIGISIPSLCYHKELTPTGNCGICLVEDLDRHSFIRACTTPIAPGMNIRTRSRQLTQIRRDVLELILSNHPDDCFYCVRNNTCELQALTKQLGVDRRTLTKLYEPSQVDDSSPSIVREQDKCILCGRCVSVCGDDIQTVHAIGKSQRGFSTVIGPPSGKMADSLCVNCGQCVAFCPTAALHEHVEKELVWRALEDEEKVLLVQMAPSVRVSLAEEFDLPIGTNLIGKMYHALKMIGFDYVLDTNFSADLTIMEEASEFLARLESGENLPLLTSCSPGWVKFVETFYHGLLGNVSSCKSPQQMFGALSKTYFAEKHNLDPAKIVTVSIMPCTAKKYEARRPEMNSHGYRDVDYVLTTREFAEMLKEAGIHLESINDDMPDDLMGQYTGAGTIFGSTGGVMEAALRTAYELATGEELPSLDVEPARGIKGLKEFSVDVKGTKLNLAVANGLGNARKVMDKIMAAKVAGETPPYHFVEIMACPGGCVGGGGQPHGTIDGSVLKRRIERASGLYKEDREMKLRKSHENPEIQKVYEEYLEKPLSHRAHELLHTHYIERDSFIL
ncbi:ferredoxin [candidate division KSB3 bacterium]|nr:MAG: ferredoxin [candidate division KSB3 bacterium]